MSNVNIKSALVSVGLSTTNGTIDKPLARAMARAKANAVPNDIRDAVNARIEAAVAAIKPGEHSRLKITFYTPKVELE